MSKDTHINSARSHDDIGTSRRCVLVAVGADGGLPALRTARGIAARESRPLVVLSVVEPPPMHGFDVEPAMPVPWAINEALAARHTSLIDRLGQLGAPSFGQDEADLVVRCGQPDRLIPTIARERKAHLVVMGTGPHTLANRILATETTLATIRRTPCPVLAVRDHAADSLRVVVAAIDFTPASLHAARQAFPLLADGAVVHLVHAWQRRLPPLAAGEEDSLDKAYELALPGRFDRARSVLGRARSLVFVASAREGDATGVLLAVARDIHADLIIAGAQGHGLMERLLVGSVSSALLRGAPCSVFVAPEPPSAEGARLQRHMTGTSSLRAPEEWAEELDAFWRRNRSRRTALEIDDPSLGAQVQETGYALIGASYDHHDRHVSLMFADPAHPEAHLTRTMSGVRSVAVSRGHGDADGALCIESDQGSSLLTFLDLPGG